MVDGEDFEMEPGAAAAAPGAARVSLYLAAHHALLLAAHSRRGPAPALAALASQVVITAPAFLVPTMTINEET